VLLGPVGAAELLHPEADLAVARAAAQLRLPYVFSSQACASMEQCAALMGDAPRWFQLYWSTDDALVDSFLARAEAAGAEAIVVTLDTTLLGWRTEDLNLGSLPFASGKGIAQYTADSRFLEIVRERIATAQEHRDVQITLGAIRTLASIARRFPGSTVANLVKPEPRAGVETFLDIYSRPSLTWTDIEGLRQRTRLPILLKGIQHPDDARRAVEAGVDGIVVSNHGGRQIDGAIASLDALAEIAPAVENRLTILFDSGIRSGADVFKAIALGADAVMVGRPYLYGLTLGGADGVRDVMENIVAELDLTLGLSGLTSVGEIDRGAVRIGR
jgi:lactate 2-monooxygenase